MTHPLHAELTQGLSALGLLLSPETEQQLLDYLDLIARWNKVYNLTAVREPRDMLRQHLLDCLAAVPLLDRADAARGENGHAAWRILDVGSGAGLPGVVLAIVRSQWQVTCVDTVAKKASFIRQVGAELGLPNLQAVHQRVEAMDTPPFDLITSRAFASLADFIALTRERLAPQGQWVAMKAHLTEDERAAVPSDVQITGVSPLTVPGLDAQRCLVWMRPATSL
ncbi:16S rRNA (guanine(527)-N(7))-methyltransferase RsmG [Ideonella oryzae]|uniref:Ribosomal RNA small subunit methyltransferase G n=1 Tax=Ideonella oryzae TaxID=2937441 RepID=A0ABT1BR19_9BURK|nr:16S rRNA (guanine(527)-N(7))-methyltransferase RsmG [Ideonella oryzae]MCO5978630.1 16S rRNA (guanine(527)-N(7))-methyltransferase RsmG [Ideonella oryzae]